MGKSSYVKHLYTFENADMSKYIIIIMALLMLVGCTKTALVKENTDIHDPYRIMNTIPEDLQIAVAKAEMFGAEIYMQDIAAWVVTDFLSDNGVLGRDKRLRGWVTEHADKEMNSGRMIVTFVGDVEGEFKGLYQVETQSGRVLEQTYLAHIEGFELTSSQLFMFKARQTALKNEFKACSDRYNTAVIKFNDEVNNYNIVYLLAGSVKHGEVMAGGNYQLIINESGEEILENNPLSKSCIVLQRTEGVAALTLSHIVEPTPNAVHVFLSLLHQVPIYILTTENKITWKVDGNKISIVKS